jgi:hypothetical protein
MKPIEITGQIFSDQTGRFPITSSKGNKYIMAVYNYDSNAILTAPITSRNEMITIQPRQTKTKTKTRNASSNVPYIIRGEWNIQILCSMGGGVVVRVLHTRRTTIVPYVLRKLQPDRDVMGGETRSAKCGQERRYSEEMRDDETMSRHTTRMYR